MSRTIPRLLAAVALLGSWTLLGVAPAEAATTVNLHTAGAFAVLAGSGITNTGQTTITGNIGTHPLPAETGVSPCPTVGGCINLTGTNHPADATALKAKQDLTSAYNAAATQPASATIVGDIGGHSFSPGVYRSATSIGLTGQVTLDAHNVSGAVFIFQAGSTLVTAGASSIKLINGASACNVFFQIGSAATLGAASTFRGTILAHDDISLGDAVTVEGRLLGGEQPSQAGAVTLIHDTVAVPNCAGAPATTPPTSPPPTSTGPSAPGSGSPGTGSPGTGSPGGSGPGGSPTSSNGPGIPQVFPVPNGGIKTGGGATPVLQQGALIALGSLLLLAAGVLAVRRPNVR